MHSSIILQTELQCLPTQLLFVDCTSNFVKSLLSPKTEEFVDVLSIMSLASIVNKNSSSENMKTNYKSLRPIVLKEFSQIYEKAYEISPRNDNIKIRLISQHL